MEGVAAEFLREWGMWGAAVILLIVYRRPIAGALAGVGGGRAVLEEHTRLLKAQADHFAANLKHFARANDAIKEFIRETKEMHNTLRQILATQQRIEAEIREQGAYMRGRDAAH